ncbi:MAG: spermidine synthase [Gammaproteobacteria bacterium]|nr:spermidine synthase [Gammaproteobacteria bacterium]MBU1724777.1 spermidine synthase [Gammaproteobacteria bacterium]MBU2005784.1 spermidine synthase [Gammaproteobacteria bacterium]
MFEDEILLHQQQDRWGNILVLDQQGHRVLSFDSIYEQSRMNLDRPSDLVHQYTRAMLLGLAFGNPAHITLFGLGGGCLLRAAHQINPNLHLQAVELRAAVVAVARDYFGLPESPHLSIEVADGRDYITRQPDACTDLIWADMYHALRADPFQMQKRFCRESQRILSDDGWLVINCHEFPPANGMFFRFLREYFKEILICVVPGGNFVVYAGKSGKGKPKSLVSLEVEVMELKTRTKLGFLLPHVQSLD